MLKQIGIMYDRTKEQHQILCFEKLKPNNHGPEPSHYPLYFRPKQLQKKRTWLLKGTHTVYLSSSL